MATVAHRGSQINIKPKKKSGGGPATHPFSEATVSDGKGGFVPLSQWVAQHPAAPAPAPAAGQPGGAPVKPADVNPFFTPQDLQSINDFNTRYAIDLANIDFELGNLQSDTTYQKGNNDKQARENTAQAADQMAARGLFQSSVKDAALYDIEASRSLANKFLDDKLTAATLNAGTQKKILGDSKKRFDEAINSQGVQNAAEQNATLHQGWADAMAAWEQAHPKPPPVAAAPKPVTAPKPGQGTGHSGPSYQPGVVEAILGHSSPAPNRSQGRGTVQPRNGGSHSGPVYTRPVGR